MPETRIERNIEAMKKTKRIYTPITNIKHLVSIFEGRGERTLFDYFDEGGAVRKITYRALAGRVRAFGSGLYRLGRVKGKRTAIIGETSPTWYIAYLASVMFGGTAIPMDKELAISEIENFLCRAEADNVVFSPLFNEKFREVAARHPEIAFIPMAGAADAPYYKSMEEIEAVGAARAVVSVRYGQTCRDAVHLGHDRHQQVRHALREEHLRRHQFGVRDGQLLSA